jgi:hypothetical protein
VIMMSKESLTRHDAAGELQRALAEAGVER